MPEGRFDGARFAVFTFCIDYLFPTETCAQAHDHMSCSDSATSLWVLSV